MSTPAEHAAEPSTDLGVQHGLEQLQQLLDHHVVGHDDVKQALIAATHAAAARGAFGAPTIFIDGEMFFGQDRLEILLWRMKQYGLVNR